jgi:hypothetical protein
MSRQFLSGRAPVLVRRPKSHAPYRSQKKEKKLAAPATQRNGATAQALTRLAT